MFFMLKITHFYKVKLRVLLELGLYWRAGFIQGFTVYYAIFFHFFLLVLLLLNIISSYRKSLYKTSPLIKP